MRLHRTLFYILLGVFLAGIIVVSIVDTNSVYSRIATGLITGSFVALVSSVVNYAYAWKQFFSKYMENAMILQTDLFKELTRARMKIKDIEETDKDTLIKRARQMTDKDDDSFDANMQKYDKYRAMFDYSPYVSLFFRKRTTNCLDEIERFAMGLGMIQMYCSTGDLFVCLQEGHFSSKEEEAIAIGDRDDFFDYLVQSNYDWRDYTAHCMRQLASQINALYQSLKPFSVGKDYKGVAEMISQSSEYALKDLPDRNPRDEAESEIDDMNS